MIYFTLALLGQEFGGGKFGHPSRWWRWWGGEEGGSGAYYAPLHLCSVLPGWGGSDLSSWALMIFSDDCG